LNVSRHKEIFGNLGIQHPINSDADPAWWKEVQKLTALSQAELKLYYISLRKTYKT